MVSEKDIQHKARASALASLAMREHCVYDLSQKLLRKQFPQLVVDQLLEDLQDKGLISDVRFAEMYWRSRSQKGYGPIRIRQELQQKQVDDNAIESGLTAAVIDFTIVIKRVYEKKYGDQGIENFQEKAKRMNYLYYRGFSRELMCQVGLS